MANLPSGLTEEYVLRAIETVVKNVAASYAFGCYDKEDMEQEGRLEAWKAIQSGDYDPSRPLENFLYVHIKNRLNNVRRNKFSRNEPPVNPTRDADGKLHFESEEAKAKWDAWYKRNQSKRNLAAPNPIEMDFESCRNVVDEAFQLELKELLDKHLDVELRADMLRLKNGVNIPKPRKNRLKEAIQTIIRDYRDNYG